VGVKIGSAHLHFEPTGRVETEVAAAFDRLLDHIGGALVTVQGLDAILSGDLGLSVRDSRDEPEMAADRLRGARRATPSLDRVTERLDRLVRDVVTCAEHSGPGAFDEIEGEFAEFLDDAFRVLLRLRRGTYGPERRDFDSLARIRLHEINLIVFGRGEQAETT
jgi:hypothetical protein